MNSNPYLIFLVLIATLGPFQFGYHLSELNAVEKNLICQTNIPTDHHCVSLRPAQWAFVQSIFTVGGLVGALSGGPGATRYGRLPALRLVACIFLLGSTLEVLALNIGMLILGRVISGVGAGMTTVVTPIYIAEISPPEKRGQFGASTQVMVNMGILSALLIGYVCSKLQANWRAALALSCLISILMAAGLQFAIETPPWLAQHCSVEVAYEALQELRGPLADIDSETGTWHVPHQRAGSLAEEQRPLLKRADTATTISDLTFTSSVSFLDAIRKPEYRRATIAVTICMVAQQLTGINSVMMYSVNILTPVIPNSAASVSIALAAMNAVMSLVCAPLADKIGRRPCLLLSIAGVGGSSVLMAVGLSRTLSWFSVTAILAFVLSFSVGLGPIPFILPSELTQAEAVGTVSSWALAGSWISAFCVAQAFPMLNAALPQGQVYWCFMGIALVFGGLVIWTVPESKGKGSPDEVWKMR